MKPSTPTTIADLNPDPTNARSHSPRNIGMLVDSLQQLGASRSIVIDEEGTVLAGNGVVEAAAEAGITKVRVVDVAGDELVAVRRTGLTPEQKVDLALRDNRVAELAEWDIPVLKALDETMDLSHLFTDTEKSKLFGEEENAPIPGIEEITLKRPAEIVFLMLAIPVEEWPKYQAEVEKLQGVSMIAPSMVTRPAKKDEKAEAKEIPEHGTH